MEKIVPSHNKVALTPHLSAGDDTCIAARQSLLLRLASARAINIGCWTRWELYD